MTALSPDNTPRYRVHYTVNSHDHTFQLRSHESPFTIGVFINAFVAAIDWACYASVINQVEFAAAGSNVFNPVTTWAESTTWGTGTGVGLAVPEYVDFIGRTSGGRRVRLAVFGLGFGDNQYRFDPGDNADIDAGIAELVSMGSSLRGIDDLTPVWKNYANMGFNAYWQKAIRP